MVRTFAIGFLLCGTALAGAQAAPSTQQPQQQNASQPGLPGTPTQPAVPDYTNGAAVPPAFAPGAAGSTLANDSLRDAPRVVKVSPALMDAQLVHRVDPVYPQGVQRNGERVVLAARIGKHGRVRNLSVVSGPVALQRASIDAVRQWLYKPYLLNGEPVEVDTTVTLNVDAAGGH